MPWKNKYHNTEHPDNKPYLGGMNFKDKESAFKIGNMPTVNVEYLGAVEVDDNGVELYENTITKDAFTFTEDEIETIKHLIDDHGFEYSLKADSEKVKALAAKLGMKEKGYEI